MSEGTFPILGHIYNKITCQKEFKQFPNRYDAFNKKQKWSKMNT